MKVETFVEIDDKEVERIFKTKLESLTKGQWITDGKVKEEGYTSHSFDYVVGDASDPQFAVLVAVLNLQRLLGYRK